MNKETIYQNIRAQGGRLTKLRKEIIQILSAEDCLISAAKLLAHLNKLKLSPNRSTIFRELLFLTNKQIVLKNNISGVDYYEIPCEHHHHLICLKCKTISKVEIADQLQKQERRIEKLNKFKIVNHSLEFYGYCRKCQA
ncbi:MAG TPA: transcriptional repressor [Candidatus Saccharimonadales bacterium]|nr:transcriptional repressor [Candidatus Saccharimonadales bacterium]